MGIFFNPLSVPYSERRQHIIQDASWSVGTVGLLQVLHTQLQAKYGLTCTPVSVLGASSVWLAWCGDSGRAGMDQTGSCPCQAHWGVSRARVGDASPSSASRWWCSSRCIEKKTVSAPVLIIHNTKLPKNHFNTSNFILYSTITTNSVINL